MRDRGKSVLVVVNGAQFQAQMLAAQRMMARMHEIAIECGGTFGEGCCFDELTMTAEQFDTYKARCEAEFGRFETNVRAEPGDMVWIKPSISWSR